MKYIGFGINVLASLYLLIQMLIQPFSWITLVVILPAFMATFIGFQFYKNYEQENKWSYLFVSLCWACFMTFFGQGCFDAFGGNPEFSTIVNYSGYLSLVFAEVTILSIVKEEGFPRGPIGGMVGSVLALLTLGIVSIPMQVYWTNMPHWLGQLGVYSVYLIFVIFILSILLAVYSVFKG